MHRRAYNGSTVVTHKNQNFEMKLEQSQLEKQKWVDMSVLKSDQTQKISSLKTHNDDNNNNGKSNISTRVTKTGKPEY